MRLAQPGTFALVWGMLPSHLSPHDETVKVKGSRLRVLKNKDFTETPTRQKPEVLVRVDRATFAEEEWQSSYPNPASDPAQDATEPRVAEGCGSAGA